MNKKIYFAIYCMFSILLLYSTNIYADPFDPNTLPQPGDFPNGIPVDGGITILAAAGIGFGIKKIKDARKHNHGACKQSEEK